MFMKPNICLPLFAAIVAFLISGCHSTHAVVRGTTVSKTPTFECISNAVIRVPGVTQIMPVNVTPEPNWTVYHRHSRQLPYENFLYLGEQNMRGMITIKPQWKGATIFQMSRIWADRTPSNEEVDLTRRLMDEIYSALSQECGGFPPLEHVSEQFLDLQSYNRSLGTKGNAKEFSP
jgi:hypothetical protein